MTPDDLRTIFEQLAQGPVVATGAVRHVYLWHGDLDALADLVTVAALLGHESVATTALYTQPGEADMVRAVEGLG